MRGTMISIPMATCNKTGPPEPQNLLWFGWVPGLCLINSKCTLFTIYGACTWVIVDWHQKI